MIHMPHKSIKPIALSLSAIVATVVTLTFTALPAKAAEQKKLFFYSWADYIDPVLTKEFEKKNNVALVYDVYENPTAAEAKLLAKSVGYDVVVADLVSVERLIDVGILQKLDRNKLPSWNKLDPALMKIMSAQDKGNLYSVPHFYGTNGFGYIPERINGLMKNAPTNSLAMIFDPNVVKNFKSCGVNFKDSWQDVLAMALIYLGKNPNPKTPADVDAAMEVLWKVRPYVTAFNSGDYLDLMASGEYCLSMIWGGDHLNVNKRAENGKSNVRFVYTLPKEGTVVWVDAFIIPKGAKNLDAAYAFLNAMMEPQFAAANTNLTGFPTAINQSKPFVEKRITDDPNTFPPLDVLAKTYILERTPNKALDAYIAKAWGRLKSGKK